MNIVSVDKDRLIELKIIEIYMNALLEELGAKTPKEALEMVRMKGDI